MWLLRGIFKGSAHTLCSPIKFSSDLLNQIYSHFRRSLNLSPSLNKEERKQCGVESLHLAIEVTPKCKRQGQVYYWLHQTISDGRGMVMEEGEMEERGREDCGDGTLK